MGCHTASLGKWSMKRHLLMHVCQKRFKWESSSFNWKRLSFCPKLPIWSISSSKNLPAFSSGVQIIYSSCNPNTSLSTYITAAANLITPNSSRVFFISILALLFDHNLCNEIVKNAKTNAKEQYNWTKIAQDTHFTYQKAICETVAAKQAKELQQERERKTKKIRQSNLIKFMKQESYA